MTQRLRHFAPSPHLFQFGILLFLLLVVGGLGYSVFERGAMPALRVSYAGEHQRLVDSQSQQEIIPALRTAASINFDDGFTQLQLLSIAYEAEDTDSIILGLRGLLNHSPDDAELHGELAIVLLRVGRLEDALIHSRIAIRRDPDVSGFHVTKGAILLALQRHQEAADSYRKALALAPDSEVAQRALDYPLKNY